MADLSLTSRFRLHLLLGQALRVLLGNIGPILLLNVLPSVPTLATLAVTGELPDEHLLVNIVLAILSQILTLVAVAMTADGAHRSLHGGRFITSEGMSRTMRHFLPLLGASILSWLLIIAGLAAFVIPGLMAICTLYLVAPTCIIEGRGSVGSMERAARLSSGHRWTIFALFVLTAVPALAASALLGDFSPKIPPNLLQSLGDEVVSLFYLAFTGVTMGVSYGALRALDEGDDTDGLVLAFE